MAAEPARNVREAPGLLRVFPKPGEKMLVSLLPLWRTLIDRSQPPRRWRREYSHHLRPSLLQQCASSGFVSPTLAHVGTTI